MGAASVPEVCGRARHPYQYTIRQNRHRQNGYAQIDRLEQRRMKEPREAGGAASLALLRLCKSGTARIVAHSGTVPA